SLAGGRGSEDFHRLRWHCVALPHDLTVHALSYHLVPRASIDEIAGRIRAALPERVASWSKPGAKGALTIGHFFDDDLNRYCYAVWCRCDEPRDFRPLFTAPRNYAQLLAALDLRIRETEEGKGDVASEKNDEMGPIGETKFEL